MRAADEHRRARANPGRSLFGALTVTVAVDVGMVVAMVVAMVIAMASVLGVSAVGSTPGGGEQLVLAVAVVTALTTSLFCISRTPSAGMRLQKTATTGASGHIEAPTAYWCALAAPRRPQRPRAPGQG